MCDFCLREGDDVRETFDPYAWEMREELRKIIACDDCRQGLADDV